LLPLSLLAILTGSTTAAADAAQPPTYLIDFSLRDQFDDLHTQADTAGRVVLLIGSDGEGSEFNDLWGKAINPALADHPNHALLYQLPYADLRSVPFFARGFARGMMPEAPQEWVLMDWKGSLAKAYRFQPGATNVLIFAADGTLSLQVAGTQPQPPVVEEIVTLLRTLLNQAAGPD
jgi:hypothetical protein